VCVVSAEENRVWASVWVLQSSDAHIGAHKDALDFVPPPCTVSVPVGTAMPGGTVALWQEGTIASGRRSEGMTEAVPFIGRPPLPSDSGKIPHFCSLNPPLTGHRSDVNERFRGNLEADFL